ncbi:hypothetical protein [Rhizorhabdus wittichii]|nr:hypothetical protein [Rhizorhabdus wittichii]
MTRFLAFVTRLAAKHLSRKARQQRKAIRETTSALRAHLIKVGKLHG